ncbi:3-oxoadipate--succinyl-CoA transferase subunit B [Planobispora takensis]|uniref:3-oxoadipate--succinyl-CoA transferase subunit B n=2 Tax=Planobispora takensis TaxID=1367882 RepID=A0A8J3WVB5_9ACTN|nr:3-oxoadipate--succinyl-CoA transferase subunit B [Planobispora takensis]
MTASGGQSTSTSGELLMSAPSPQSYTADEMMTVAAARRLRGGSCFVGIGLPSLAANLARRTHAPDLVLIYESGTIGAKPDLPPLSIGDGVLAETADSVVSVPEIFNYWLQPGRIDVGFLGAAQIDRYANINTTVIGPYDDPKVRLPGAGGAPEIAASCGEVTVIVRQSPRAFVDRVDFVTSVGFGSGPGDRERLGLRGRGPRTVITDLGILEPDPVTCELVLTHLHPGVTLERARAATGWELAAAPGLRETEPPADHELAALRALTGGHRS